MKKWLCIAGLIVLLTVLGISAPRHLRRHRARAAAVAGNVAPAASAEPTLATAVATFPPDVILEREPNDTPSADWLLSLPFKVGGTLEREGDVDCFAFSARANTEIGVRITALGNQELNIQLNVTDSAGTVVAGSNAGYLGFRVPRDDVYFIAVHDWQYRGVPSLRYVLEVGDLPVVTSIYPLGVQAGTSTLIELHGVNLGKTTTAMVDARTRQPGDRVPFSALTASGRQAIGRLELLVGEYPELRESALVSTDANTIAQIPSTLHGRVATKFGSLWAFSAKAQQAFVFEINAQRLGSPLDSVLEVLDQSKKPVIRARLRSVFQTSLDIDMEGQFDSATDYCGVVDASQLAFNDYLFLGSELVRLRSVPHHSNEHCRFYIINGKRAGYLDTTPTHHGRTGVPVHKVVICPPDATPEPSSGPLFDLPYRNDDGGPYLGKDSCLHFRAPADGQYFVRVSDAHERSGRDFVYRLTVRGPKPSFVLELASKAEAGKSQVGCVLPVAVRVKREDGFQERVDLQFDELPACFASIPSSIGPDEDSGVLPLVCRRALMSNNPLRIVARSAGGDKPMVRTMSIPPPALVARTGFAVTARPAVLGLMPGQTGALTVGVQRPPGVADAISLAITGLPPGVSVYGVAASGIVIPEGEMERTIQFTVEDAAHPLKQPVIIQAQHPQMNGVSIGTTVLLRVTTRASGAD